MLRNKIFTPNEEYDDSNYTVGGVIPLKLFLGGTIDNGNSENWQKTLIDALNGVDTVHPIMVYNPRRDEWPSQGDKAEISRQIKWELHHLELSNLIVMNILGDSKSPISLMEIGLFAKDNKLIVFCPKEFYRFENVMEVCERYRIPLYTTNDISMIRDKVLEYAQKDAKHNYNKAHLYDDV